MSELQITQPTSTRSTVPRRRRRVVRSHRNPAVFYAWIALGLVSYICMWVAMTNRDDRSYQAISNLNMNYQQILQEREANLIQEKEARRKSAEKEKEERQKQSNLEHRWAAAALWIIVVVLSYHRIKTDEWRRRDQRNPRSNTQQYHNRHEALLTRRTINREAMMRTLRRINEERQAQQQEIISIDAVEAFQRALMQDREIWMGLAMQQQGQLGRSVNQGATPEQLLACPQHNPTADDEGECIICLGDLCQDLSATLRTLPCNHSFHSACIDRWLEKSKLCPICKSALDEV